MTVTREQLFQVSKTIGGISVDLVNMSGKVIAAIQGSGTERLRGVTEHADDVTSSINKATEAADKCVQLIRDKVSWMEANGVGSLE